MLPLIPIALTIVPEIAKWLFGAKGGSIATAAAGLVESVTGTSDPAAASLAIADPKVRAELQIKLAEIAANAEADQRAADLAALQAQLSDVASARSQTVALAQAGSAAAWAAPIVSVLVLGTFGFGFWYVFHTGPGEASQTQVGMVEALKVLATAVVSYWVGSSAGSRSKQAQISELAGLAAQQVPADLVRDQ